MNHRLELSSLFRAVLGGAWPEGDERLSDLEPLLAELLADARRAWPQLTLPEDAVIDWWARRVGNVASVEPTSALRALRTADLYLALGCARGDPAALAAFDAHCLQDLAGPLRRLGLSPDQIDELKQELRRLLFINEPDRTAAIERYGGSGDLRSWVRVIAVRQGGQLLRRDHPSSTDVEAEAERASDLSADLELAYLKRRYAPELKAAWEAAFAQLSARDRNVLRCHASRGLTIDEIGAIYRVHRVTAYRWLVQARQHLLEQARQAIQARLGVGGSELESLVRLLRSELDPSIHRLLD